MPSSGGLARIRFEGPGSSLSSNSPAVITVRPSSGQLGFPRPRGRSSIRGVVASAATRRHKLHGLKQLRSSAHSSGGQKAKFEVSAGLVPSGGLGEESVPCHASWRLVAPGSAWFSLACSCLAPISAFLGGLALFSSVSSPHLIRHHQSLALGPTLNLDAPICRSVTDTSAKTQFPEGAML